MQWMLLDMEYIEQSSFPDMLSKCFMWIKYKTFMTFAHRTHSIENGTKNNYDTLNAVWKKIVCSKFTRIIWTKFQKWTKKYKRKSGVVFGEYRLMVHQISHRFIETNKKPICELRVQNSAEYSQSGGRSTFHGSR